MGDAATRWRDALASWAIPPAILDAAPVSPWAHLPGFHRSSADDPTDTPSMRAAFAALGEGGTVLDVGCGGGRSSVPLGRSTGLVRHLTGVDEQADMLEQFHAAATRAGIDHDVVQGRWPDVERSAPTVDLVVCHHVAYNVGDIEPFVLALHAHATRAVVIELTEHHPQTPLNDLWRHFWDLDRPSEPSAALFADVVRDLGLAPVVTPFDRPTRSAPVADAELVAHVRQRLCLTADRDPEIAAVLGERPLLTADRVVTVTWRCS